MAATTHPPETDLLVPLPREGEVWDPHTIHTHYFGLTVPEERIGAFIYLRYMPAFRLCQGGVLVYQGLNNLTTVDAVFQDYEITMPWPEIVGTSITTANGLSLDFIEPGTRIRVRYRSSDGGTSLDIEATAVTPLSARGHVIPGEELHTSAQSGGSEQFVHSLGEMTLHDKRYTVDCVTARDRSWRQIRKERRDANLHPPVAWTPIYLGEDLAFNQVGIEAPDTDPAWIGLYDIPDGAPTHHYGWVYVDGEMRSLARVRRTVHELDPALLAPLRMTVEADDDTGASYRFDGEAIALCPFAAWPNVAAFDSVYEWTDSTGRRAHGSVQTMYVEAYAAHLKGSRAALLDGIRARRTATRQER